MSVPVLPENVGRPVNILEQHTSEGPDVGLHADRQAASLLRAHVRDGALNHPVGGLAADHRRRHRQLRVVRGRVERLGQAKVQEPHPAVRRDLDVGRLQIAMDDAPRVGSLESNRDVARDSNGVSNSHRAGGQRLGEGDPRHELHDEELQIAHPLQAVDARDARMIQ